MTVTTGWRGVGNRLGRWICLVSLLGGLAACDPAARTGPAEELPEAEAPAMPGAGPDEGKTVLYRDTYGVPHIYAPSVEAGLYAQGWAQAEDRPEQLLLNLKIAMGELTGINGEDGLSTSLVSHMFGHMRNARRSVAAMPERERRRVVAFANGITDFYAAHPEDLPPWWDHEAVTPEMRRWAISNGAASRRIS